MRAGFAVDLGKRATAGLSALKYDSGAYAPRTKPGRSAQGNKRPARVSAVGQGGLNGSSPTSTGG